MLALKDRLRRIVSVRYSLARMSRAFGRGSPPPPPWRTPIRAFLLGVDTMVRHELHELMLDLETEVARHKWLASERAGRDVGWRAAEADWLQHHFPDWKRDRWRQCLQAAAWN